MKIIKSVMIIGNAEFNPAPLSDLIASKPNTEAMPNITTHSIMTIIMVTIIKTMIGLYHA